MKPPVDQGEYLQCPKCGGCLCHSPYDDDSFAVGCDCGYREEYEELQDSLSEQNEGILEDHYRSLNMGGWGVQ